MKTLLTLFVLLFSSSMFADDISDFEIEGIRIGDSALKYFKCHIFFETNINRNTFDIISKGMLSIQTILYDTNVDGNAIYFISGPQQMILSFMKKLMKAGILENKIIIDAWE